MPLKIHPSVGVARLGNSHGQFCLAPDTIGGLPFESDSSGNKLGPVVKFKDDAGRIRRQGQLFNLYNAEGEEITLATRGVSKIEWTVHLANKKAAWYQYSELDGNLLFGEQNSYANKQTPWRNATVPNEQMPSRQELIVDPGWRKISGANAEIGFDKTSVPHGYPAQYPTSDPKHGSAVTTLGDLKTDDAGRLIVLGGFGHAGGDTALTSYGGADTWHDDISDGPVYCTVTYEDGTTESTQAWVVVGSPDFAPEIVNISTLADTMFDVGVRCFDLVPDMCKGGQYNTEYLANYQRDILPIIRRMSNYQWVSNVQPMMAMTSNIFDFSDNSEANRSNRETYLSYFRHPNAINSGSANQPSKDLFQNAETMNFPLMPINSGSNSVSNDNIVKFLALDTTQYFLLTQWAAGKFESKADFQPYPVSHMDTASVGNCVGLPMCPGIEVTWSMQNQAIYAAPFVIADEKGIDGYNETGLDPSRDECEGGGCQPGDLTKRMACPWQADFFQCTIQYVNFTNPDENKDNGDPLPPMYYSYWWPPQAPWDVITGELTPHGQKVSNTIAGQQLNYARGINQFSQMVEYWWALAFIRNRNANAPGFPFFTETERNNELFSYKEVPMSEFSGTKGDEETMVPVWYIRVLTQTNQAPEALSLLAANDSKAAKMVDYLENRAFKAIEIAEGGLGKPRSGTRARR